MTSVPAASRDHHRLSLPALLAFSMPGLTIGALAVALGVAEARADRAVVALLGDGDLLMGAGALWSLSGLRPPNLLVLVLDDGRYSITGGQSVVAPEALAALTSSFAATADRHDRDGSFPFENIAALKDAGLLALTAPKALGGQGADLPTALAVIRAVARGEPATALVLDMKKAE